MSNSKQAFRGMKPSDVTPPTQPQEPAAPPANPEPPAPIEPAQPEPSKTPNPEPTTFDVNNLSEEEQGFVNLLTKSFGYELDDITERELKMAKSYVNIQSLATTKSQESQTKAEQLQALQGLFEENPTLLAMVKKAANGEPIENQIPAEPKPVNPTTVNSQVDEATLIQSGYLKEGDLQGLEGIARDRAIFQAELRYSADQFRNQFKENLVAEQKSFREQQLAEQIKQENQSRVDSGMKQLIVQGIDLAGLEQANPGLIQKITHRANLIGDPTNAKLIDRNAIAMAAQAELSVLGVDSNPVTLAPPTLDGLQDTGKHISKQQPPAQPKKKPTLEEQLEARARERGQGQSLKNKFRTSVTTKN